MNGPLLWITVILAFIGASFLAALAIAVLLDRQDST